jgi:hypothetical protein
MISHVSHQNAIDRRLVRRFRGGEGSYHIANSMGFNKALAVPSRMLQMIYGNFVQGDDEARLDAEMREWGAYLVSTSTPQHNKLLKMVLRAGIVSFKIFPCLTEFTTIRMTFRRNREELGYLEMNFNSEGLHAGTVVDLY